MLLNSEITLNMVVNDLSMTDFPAKKIEYDFVVLQFETRKNQNKLILTTQKV